MKLLLDTHILLWLAGDTLPHSAAEYILADNIMAKYPAPVIFIK